MAKGEIGTVDGEVVQMAQSIGSDMAPASTVIGELSHLNLGTFLENLGREFGMGWSEWQHFLVQAQAWSLNRLESVLNNLQFADVNKNTAKKFVEDFGVPQSNEALPVAALLRRMFDSAENNFQLELVNAETVWLQIKTQVFEMLQLFLATQINEKENLREQYMQAIKKTKEEMQLMDKTPDDIAKAVIGLEKIIKDLELEVGVLMQTIFNIGGRAIEKTQRTFQRVRFESTPTIVFAA